MHKMRHKIQMNQIDILYNDGCTMFEVYLKIMFRWHSECGKTLIFWDAKSIRAKLKLITAAKWISDWLAICCCQMQQHTSLVRHRANTVYKRFLFIVSTASVLGRFLALIKARSPIQERQARVQIVFEIKCKQPNRNSYVICT